MRTDPSISLDKALDSGELDIALLSFSAVEDPGELIHREPLVWVTVVNHATHELDPVPVATTESYCQMRRNALAALDTAGVNYRIACISRSYMGLQTFVLSGLAVSHVGESSVVSSMRVLEPDNGFSPIGSVDVGIRMAPGLTEPAVERRAGAVAARLKYSVLL